MKLNEFNTKNYYQILGVSPDSSTDLIRDVYRDIAKVYHPDSGFYDEIVGEKTPTKILSIEQEQVFMVITAAYNTLIDPKKRAEYDTRLSALNVNVPAWGDNKSGSIITCPHIPVESQQNGTKAKSVKQNKKTVGSGFGVIEKDFNTDPNIDVNVKGYNKKNSKGQIINAQMINLGSSAQVKLFKKAADFLISLKYYLLYVIIGTFIGILGMILSSLK